MILGFVAVSGFFSQSSYNGEMGRALSKLNEVHHDSEVRGQAVIEYLLMMVVSLSLVGILATGFRKALIPLWGYYIKHISAACPSCPVDPRYRLR